MLKKYEIFLLCKCKIGLLYIIGENMIAMYMSFIDSEDDREKFEIIYHEYRKRMVSVAYSILLTVKTLRDAVHETFIRIAKNMKPLMTRGLKDIGVCYNGSQK